MMVSELMQIRVGAGEPVRNSALRPVDLGNDGTWVRFHQLMEIKFIVRSSNEWLGQIDGIGNDGNNCEKVSVSDPVLRYGGFIAQWKTITPNVVLLEVIDGNRQHVTFPFTCG